MKLPDRAIQIPRACCHLMVVVHAKCLASLHTDAFSPGCFDVSLQGRAARFVSAQSVDVRSPYDNEGLLSFGDAETISGEGFRGHAHRTYPVSNPNFEQQQKSLPGDSKCLLVVRQRQHGLAMILKDRLPLQTSYRAFQRLASSPVQSQPTCLG